MNVVLVSKYLQRLRKSLGFTQDDLAKRLNVSRQAVSKWETGTTIPDLEVLLALSKLYGLTINAILEPDIRPRRVEDFEQISAIPEDELKKILEQFDTRSLAVASMGASPEVNHLLERLFPEMDYQLEREKIGRVRIEEVEDAQKEIVSMINLTVI
ncbi:MAG: helix-turn-helix domain-containing protein [Coprococcus sp.]|nr:helix-turn-helix domain-containing protein [Coprococcus sp.]